MKTPKSKKHARKAKPRASQARKGNRIFPSIANAAASLGITPETLKLAKRSGCPAFSARGSVDEAKLLEWLKANPELSSSGTVSTKALIDMEILRRHRRNNDREDGKLIERSIVNAAIAGTLGPLTTMLTQKLENEAPAICVGLDIPGIRVKMKQLNDAIRAEFSKLVEAWPE